MATITLRDVGKRFAGGAPAVHDVNLEIRDGELFVLLGPSGCGKSTLLNLIVGLEEPTSGSVSVDGRPMKGVEPGRRNMAMVFQSYAIYPHMSVRENLAFPLQIAGVPSEEREARVAEAAEILEIEDLLDRRPATLSGGQRQRVAMGRAIVRDPVAFLLDEPLSNLDARLRGQMRTEIARLHRRLGTTTVYVTHDQTEALTLADRMAVLRRGEVQQVGTPQEVYARPANRFVASFLGAPPMTFVPGVRKGDEVVCALGRVRVPGLGARRGDTGRPEVEVGVRPEDVREAGSGERVQGRGPSDLVPRPTDVADSGHAGPLRFSARVELVEWLGAETYAHVEIEGADARGTGPSPGRHRRLLARLSPGSTASEGAIVDLEVDVHRVHFFDGRTGARLADS